MTALGNGRVMISRTQIDYSPLSKHIDHYLNQGGERVHSSSRLKVNRVGGWRPALRDAAIDRKMIFANHGQPRKVELYMIT